MRIIKRAGIFGFVIVPTQGRLSFQKYSIDEIASICQVHRTTVSLWIDNWNELGSTGLEDGERTGRPPILTVEEQEKAFATAMKNPRVSGSSIERNRARNGERNQPLYAQKMGQKKDCIWKRILLWMVEKDG